MRNITTYIVDTFIKSGTNFSGNPAAVCILNFDDDISDDVKFQISKELSQPATAFLSRGWHSTDACANKNTDATWTIRWFAPSSELPLCGHGSMAAANVIFTKLMQPCKSVATITFKSRNGEYLTAAFDVITQVITLSFPSCPTVKLNISEFPWLTNLVQHTVGEISSTCVEDIQYSAVGGKILLRLSMDEKLDSWTVIRNMKPNLKEMMKVVPESFGYVLGVGITIENNETGHSEPLFYSRFFAPWVGIDEDPVCGSLHAILGPYWSKIFDKQNNDLMMTRFASPREGDIFVKLDGDRVLIGGRTSRVLEGILNF